MNHAVNDEEGLGYFGCWVFLSAQAWVFGCVCAMAMLKYGLVQRVVGARLRDRLSTGGSGVDLQWLFVGPRGLVCDWQ